MKYDVEIGQKFDVSLPTLWKAITQLDQMKQWFFTNIPTFKAEVGFQTTFKVENEGRVFHHIWTITEVKEDHKIT